MVKIIEGNLFDTNHAIDSHKVLYARWAKIVTEEENEQL